MRTPPRSRRCWSATIGPDSPSMRKKPWWAVGLELPSEQRSIEAQRRLDVVGVDGDMGDVKASWRQACRSRYGGSSTWLRLGFCDLSLTALALIAAAAVAHASWNFFAKQARGGLPFVWVAGLCAVTLYALPAALQLLIGDKPITAAGVAFMAGSGCLHSAYFTTLQRGYAEGDLSVVYPLARGTGPALSVLLAIVILGERPGRSRSSAPRSSSAP